MPEKFGAIAVTPPVAPVRDQRRSKVLVLRWNEEIPEVVEVKAVAAVEADEEKGIEAVAAVEAIAPVAMVPAGSRIVSMEFGFAKFSSTDEKHPVKNPGGVVSQDGANLYKGDNLERVLGEILADTATAEINRCLAEDNIDD